VAIIDAFTLGQLDARNGLPMQTDLGSSPATRAYWQGYFAATERLAAG